MMSNMKRTKRAKEKKRLPFGIITLTVMLALLLFLFLLLTLSIPWTLRNYDNIGFDEIVFHLNMPLKGASIYMENYRKVVLLPAIGISVEVIASIVMVSLFLGSFTKTKTLICQIRKWMPLIVTSTFVVWAVVLLYLGQVHFKLLDYVGNLTRTSKLIEEEYVDPREANITFPAKKRNLIQIFIESGETSAQDVDNGGQMPENYVPEMTDIARNNINFSQTELISGAAVAPYCGWTIAGMVAQTAGLPLKVYNGGACDMDQYDTFMPTIVTLGDILEDEGYHNVFMAGSDFDFSGRRHYCITHGNYEILDLFTARERGIIPENYYVWWGFEDQFLYDWARKELTSLASKEQPFNFTMLTVDTHAQDGYVCNICENEYEEQYANVWRCASRQLGDFVTWLQKQDFYEDTIIVITGDHYSMDLDFYPSGGINYNAYNEGRGVYNAFLNTDISTEYSTGRKFTTLDFFPTTVAALGAQIEGERLGLGTNLFSGKETLSEKYGYDYFFEELYKRSPYYNKHFMYAK